MLKKIIFSLYLFLGHFGWLSGQQDSILFHFESKVDSVIKMAIDSHAFPGAQILVANKEEILFEKAYGFHTYDSLRMVEAHHLYDLASITKVSTGLPILMNLVAKGKVDLDEPVSKYLSQWKRSNKKNLTIREILSHQAGLKPYLVFYADMKSEDDNWKKRSFKNKRKGKYQIHITDSLFMHKRHQRQMTKKIRKTPLGEKTYRYSGLFFQMLPKLIEKIKERSFLEVLDTELYKPLGISKELTYLPLYKFNTEDIIPTEIDSNFRYQLVHGTVHDEAAAMWGGVSCNAGLFGNARSLGKLFQLYLNNGIHNNIRLIDSNTLKEFTTCQFCEEDNRRGLGFDKPRIEYDEILSSVAKDASQSSFGHSGFTGTLAWADPDHELIYIFLSNRVYPSRKQRKIYEMNVRPTIHQLIYDYFGSKDEVE